MLKVGTMRSNDLDGLKVALQRFELMRDASRNLEATAELKSILVDHIARLELVKAIGEPDACLSDDVESLPGDVEIVRLPSTDDGQTD
jgi:hypothetical protein